MTRALLFVSWIAVAACGAGASVRPAPPSTEVSELALPGVSADGRAATIRFGDFWTPGGAGVLAVRVQGGAWCGTCLWQAEHTRELFERAGGERVQVVDLVVGDRDGAPATVADARDWRERLDRPVAVAADPGFSLRALAPPGGTTLPLIVLVDTATLRVETVLENPDPAELSRALDGALGVRGSEDEALVDGLFHRNEWDMIQAIRTPGAPPPDPSDAVADDPRAAALGKELFFDGGLSPKGVSCASCHDPKKDLSDDLPESHGVGQGDRKTPRIALAAFSRFQFWDGRADSLWAQATGPIENPTEMGSSRAFVAARVATAYADAYGELFPTHAIGDATQVLVDVGKALEAYERTLRVQPTRLDAYAAGDFSALTPLEKQGLSVFAGAGCLQCHWGPRLTDDAFHVTRTATGRVDGAADRGWIDGRAALAASPFSSCGPYSDARCEPHALAPGTLGAFKTPSLRGVAGAKYFDHGGRAAALSDVLLDYGSGGLDASDPRAVGVREPWLPRFGETTRWSIATFLATLTSSGT